EGSCCDVERPDRFQPLVIAYGFCKEAHMLYVSYLAANPGPQTMVDLFPQPTRKLSPSRMPKWYSTMMVQSSNMGCQTRLGHKGAGDESDGPLE
ncbi:MAG: hypothetical protein NTZ04_03665, partial [Chloroflexi bacterium]|nr:hypothetical protein [Chloroflexota bacterium]